MSYYLLSCFCVYKKSKMSVLVLDINGVLACIPRHSVHPKPTIKHDLVLPSNQKVYIRPHMEEFISFIKDRGCYLVMWTSRKKVNAEPIEAFLHSKYGLSASMYLHGEDCIETRDFHPVKDSRILRKLLPAHLRSSKIIFVDDESYRIKGDSRTIRINAETFDARNPSEGEEDKVYKLALQIDTAIMSSSSN